MVNWQFKLMKVMYVVECQFGYISNPFLLGFHRNKLYNESYIYCVVLAGNRRDVRHFVCLHCITLTLFSFKDVQRG